MTAGPRFPTVSRMGPDPSGAEPPSEPAGYPLPAAADVPAADGIAAGQGTDYDAGTKAAGVLLAIFLPLIALIAALILRGSEANPLRRASLRAWAVASGAWLGVGLLAGIIAIAAIASSAPQVSNKGPCVGGPVMGSVGQPVGNGNYRFDCDGGGSTVVHLGG